MYPKSQFFFITLLLATTLISPLFANDVHADESPVDVEKLQQNWCLVRVENALGVQEANRTWEFSETGIVAYQRFNNSESLTEAAYDVVGNVIQTSLALQFTVLSLSDDAMVLRSKDARLMFSQGSCD